MADLQPLIRLHKYELDEKRRVLSQYYSDMAMLERKRQALEAAFEAEKEALRQTADVSFTFASYAEKVQREREALLEAEKVLELKIQQAKDSLMESFAELKKYEMTQAERDRIEAEERAFKESVMLDEIALEGFRRKSADEQ